MKPGKITDSDRLFMNLSTEICNKYIEVGIELGLTSKSLINELETGVMQMQPGNRKALKMLQLWRDSVVDKDLTYSVLATALENQGYRRLANKYCFTAGVTGNHMNIA